MKSVIRIFLIAFIVLAGTVMWFNSSESPLFSVDSLHYVIILIVVVFAIFVGIRRFNSVKRGEPTEDELSKKVMLKTAAWSYYISLYIWVAILIIKDRVNLDAEELIGTGILGMALSFAVCWLVFNFRGVKNE